MASVPLWQLIIKTLAIGMPVAQQSLVLDGRQLCDARTLATYDSAEQAGVLELALQQRENHLLYITTMTGEVVPLQVRCGGNDCILNACLGEADRHTTAQTQCLNCRAATCHF